jgi:predicted phosphoribosyltransferase
MRQSIHIEFGARPAMPRSDTETGATMIAALHAVPARNPAQLVRTVPVTSTEALTRVSDSADQAISLIASEEFDAISRFYAEFPQVSDDEGAAILEAAHGGSGQSTALIASRAGPEPK